MAMHTCTRHYPHTPIIYNRISFFVWSPGRHAEIGLVFQVRAGVPWLLRGGDGGGCWCV